MRVHIYIVSLLLIDSFPLSPQLLQQWMYKQDLMNRYCGFDVCAILSLSQCTSAQGMYSGISRKYIYRPRTKYNGKVMFSVCLSVHWEGGYPSLWFQVPSLPLVPGLFQGRRGYPGLWSQVPSLPLVPGVFQGGRGYPGLWSQVLSRGRGGGTPVRSKVRVPPPLPARIRMGGGGTPVRSYVRVAPSPPSPPPPDSTHRGQDTPRAVRLLRSSKRTRILVYYVFLLYTLIFVIILSVYK